MSSRTPERKASKGPRDSEDEAIMKPWNLGEEDDEAESDSDSDSESDDETLADARPDGGTVRKLEPDNDDDDDDNTPVASRILKILNSKSMRKLQEEEEKDITYIEDLFDFPPDPDNWREEDLKELWADAPLGMKKPGWDPYNVNASEVRVLRDEINEGRNPPIQPFYVPYRKPYPAIPDNHPDISNPKSVIEELDRIEEFLKWVSFIFPDGSSYEGTVWDDMAHGKGVYIAEKGLIRYEGEWLQNDMEGHGVVEVDIPVPEPIPGSKLEAKMRARGHIFSRDFMSPEDKKWLEMDIEDSVRLANGAYVTPFYESYEWVKQFGEKPEKGRYRYAGQWKQGRMHGCGVYQVNERTTWGRFYFGELLEESSGCDSDFSAMHAGIAEVAAAKARMFVNKPDGMVREYYGPYSDPQHAYFYEEEDVWMAPGFVNQFYDVPDPWQTYVLEVDKEREMWLNSFYQAPLRLPMPAELEHWWSTYKKPEFVLVNNEPEPDPEDPSKLIRPEDPLILHTPTGRYIDYVEDEEHGIRLFWLPEEEEEENVDLEEVEFLPLGFDEFYGKEVSAPKDAILKSDQDSSEQDLQQLDKRIEEKKKASEARVALLNEELELVEAELRLKEAMDELDHELKIMQKEEEDRMKRGLSEDGDMLVSEPTDEVEQTPREVETEKDEEEDEEEDDTDPSSFGSIEDQSSRNDNISGSSPFAAASLSFACSGLVSLVPSHLQNSFLSWKQGQSQKQAKAPPVPTTNASHQSNLEDRRFASVRFPPGAGKSLNLRCSRQAHTLQRIPKLRLRGRSDKKGAFQLGQFSEHFSILSLHTPLPV